MKKYGEIFINEDNSWLARWYEGDELIETKEGKAKDYDTAQANASAWIETKKGAE